MSELLDAAVDYGARGWKVHPCREAGERSKAPYLPHGLKEASTDADTIRAWWSRWPDALIGVVVPDRYVVLDVDTRHIPECSDLEDPLDRMGAGLDALYSVTGPLPDTLTAMSGRGDGGIHLYYRTPDLPERWAWRAHPVTADGEPLEGVDVRAAGRAYVIAPPSLHPDTGKPYVWAPLRAARLPERALSSIVRRPDRKAAPAAVRTVRTVQAGSDGLVRTVAEAPEGQRNATTFWAACRALDDGLGEDELRAIGEAAIRNGLTETEVRRTIDSALNTPRKEKAA